MSDREYIVVGAGSAGCMLAARLVATRDCRVTLIEPPSQPAKSIDRIRPARWLNLVGSSDDWGYATAPQSQLASRRIPCPRGRGVGGSSRINSMIWFPPTSTDFEHLDNATQGDWKKTQLASAFENVESMVQPEPPRWLSDASQRFLQAADGLPGSEPMTYRRLNRNGRRWLPGDLIRNDDRVDLIRGTVDRLIWDSDRAAGVRAKIGNDSIDLTSSHGVILCAGTIATPAILQRSGVGERDTLSDLGIDVRGNLPAVGRNLRDHLIVPVVFQRGHSVEPFRATHSTRSVARWQHTGTGPIASNIAECGGLFEHGSIQIHVTPTHYLRFPDRDEPPAMTIGVNATQPRSSGHVRLASLNPDVPPVIEANYLQDERDLQTSIAGVRVARKIASCVPLDDTIRKELIPGITRDSDDAIARSIQRYAQTLYHPIGTCRLGSRSDSVIDSGFAVHGTSRLWVVDASILPEPTIGNPNSMLMAIGWFAAEQLDR